MGCSCTQKRGKGADFICGDVRSAPPSQPTSVSQGLILRKVSLGMLQLTYLLPYGI